MFIENRTKFLNPDRGDMALKGFGGPNPYWDENRIDKY